MQKDNNIKYANFGARMLANIIDTFLSIIIVYPIYEFADFILGPDKTQAMLASGELHPNEITTQQLIEVVSRQLAIFSFQALALVAVIIGFWVYRSATPGKIFMKIKIVDERTNDKPSTIRLVVRCFSYIISLLPLGLGFIMIYYSKKHQGLHDKIAGTAVIKEG